MWFSLMNGVVRSMLREALEHAGISARGIAHDPGLPLPVFEIITARSPHAEPKLEHDLDRGGVGVRPLLHAAGTHN